MQIEQLLYDTTYKIIKREGSGISGRITFEANSSFKLTKEDIHRLQAKMGYDARGYSHFNLYEQPAPLNMYRYTWQCSTSCD